MGNPDVQWKNHRRVRDFHCHVRFSDRVCPGRVEVGETHKVLFFFNGCDREAIHNLSGWWFGTFFIFPFSWEFHHPN